jgi:hypothetical protein
MEQKSVKIIAGLIVVFTLGFVTCKVQSADKITEKPETPEIPVTPEIAAQPVISSVMLKK